MLKLCAKFAACKSGATAIEYGLIAAGIAVAVSAVIFTFGDQIAGIFTDMGDAIDENVD